MKNYLIALSLNINGNVSDNGIIHMLDSLIHLLQLFALPCGIIMALWGVLEYMLGKGDGRDKIKKALVGYILVFIIPLIFYRIYSAFNV